MSSTAGARSPATLADLLAIPEDQRFHEIINGELVRKAMPSFEHGDAQSALASRIKGPFGRRPGGKLPGGWPRRSGPRRALRGHRATVGVLFGEEDEE